MTLLLDQVMTTTHFDPLKLLDPHAAIFIYDNEETLSYIVGKY